MSLLFGNLGLSDSDYVYSATVGQRAIWDEAQAYLDRMNASLRAQMAAFVERDTDAYTERYFLPGNGYMQETAFQDDVKPAPVKAGGYWDVAYPLHNLVSGVVGSQVQMSYMTIGALRNHVQSVELQYANTMRRHMLLALTTGANGTFVDPLHGSLTIRRLANGTIGSDTTLYPPVIGSMTEAVEEHYAETGFVATAIDDTHDPWTGAGMTTPSGFSIVDELEEHFGIGAGSSEIASFINKAEVAEVSALTAFAEVPIAQIVPGGGSTAALATSIPQGLPGTVIGRHAAGAWIVRWDFIPANYILSIHLGARRPLVRRVDPAATGLGGGNLQLISENEEYPFKESYWRARCGFGVGNRLNGCVVECGTGASYTDPTIT